MLTALSKGFVKHQFRLSKGGALVTPRYTTAAHHQTNRLSDAQSSSALHAGALIFLFAPLLWVTDV